MRLNGIQPPMRDLVALAAEFGGRLVGGLVPGRTFVRFDGVQVPAAAAPRARRADRRPVAAHRTVPGGAGGRGGRGVGLCIAVAERLRLPVTGRDQHWETLDLEVPYLPVR